MIIKQERKDILNIVWNLEVKKVENTGSSNLNDVRYRKFILHPGNMIMSKINSRGNTRKMLK